jgi:hypothetical protein
VFSAISCRILAVAVVTACLDEGSARILCSGTKTPQFGSHVKNLFLRNTPSHVPLPLCSYWSVKENDDKTDSTLSTEVKWVGVLPDSRRNDITVGVEFVSIIRR